MLLRVNLEIVHRAVINADEKKHKRDVRLKQTKMKLDVDKLKHSWWPMAWHDVA